jgi:hypothetical protein
MDREAKEIRARGDTADVATVQLTPDEYDKYLKVVYKAAKFDKPRNPRPGQVPAARRDEKAAGAERQGR